MFRTQPFKLMLPRNCFTDTTVEEFLKMIVFGDDESPQNFSLSNSIGDLRQMAQLMNVAANNLHIKWNLTCLILTISPFTVASISASSNYEMNYNYYDEFSEYAASVEENWDPADI
uniref:Uncharacterized protein n=1 Tax=Plectus sambesii TaxID=2011161 RepID=A0A914WFS3_9BILA